MGIESFIEFSIPVIVHGNAAITRGGQRTRKARAGL